MKTMVQVRKLHMPFVPDSEIDLTVPEGSVIGITGDIGVGKSELLRYLAGIRRPGEMGLVLVDGLDPYSHLDERKLRRVASYVPQSCHESLLQNTVARELVIGPENTGWEPEKSRRAVKKGLKVFGLPAGKKRVSILSTGEAVRTMIAGLSLDQPELLLMDDILALLHAGEALELLRFILGLARKSRQTVIFVSRRQEELMEADRVYRLEMGRLFDCTEKIMHASDLGMDIRSEKQTIRKNHGKSEESKNDETGSASGNKDLKNYAWKKKEAFSCKCTGVFKKGADPFLHVSHWRPSPGTLSLSFQFRPTGAYRVRGGTGAGKSEFLKMLAGRTPVAEGILLHDNETAFRPKELIQIVGYAPADPADDFIRDTVLEDVFTGLPLEMSKEGKKEAAKDILRRIGFPEEKLRANPRKLSFGEMRLVSLAGAMARQNGLLVADNPFAGLDQTHMEIFLKMVKEMRKEGMCFVYSE